MKPALLGWPDDGVTLRLDHRRFSYAGKFVMSNTGKAVLGDPGDGADGEKDGIVAAVAFDEDRTAPDVLRLRYVTVRNDHRGGGLGPRLCRFVADRATERGYDRLRIAVNNPFAYEALYRAGFAYVGEETGLAELLLERPAGEPASDRSRTTYQAGLDVYRDRELSGDEEAFLSRKRGRAPPATG
mgnify:FL=1